ncbi:BLUF domain-containing protein [Xylophilus sp. GOD-11R]|uniref:BLUF domain-containing protein n=1 Tax=Xylophilus sp. GOD-11R TaxID=3089814 RepID=UPI00298D44C8|nr:BLUF domain-containing protein [Xylophilus sp. GOD-11R]WPB56331.1 BLUF domain-containing protein [Xylophilus sp. GOD-11R]
MPSPYYSLLAVSDLAPDTPVQTVPMVFSAVRRSCPPGVSGVLVFDGAGFCLYLEGERDAVIRCYESAREVSGQTGFQEIFHGPRPHRRYDRIASGYAPTDDMPASEQLRPLADEAAMDQFLALAPGFDLSF